MEDIQLLQISEVATIHITQCKINIIQSVYRCGMFSHFSLVPGGLSTFVLEISREDCLKIHNHQTYKLQNGRILSNIKLNASTTHTEVIAGSVDESGNCNGAPYTYGVHSWDKVVVFQAMEFTIIDYQSSVRLEDNMVLLRNNVLCPYLPGRCTDPDYGMSFWNLITDTSCEQLKYDVLWQGVATKILKTDKSGNSFDTAMYTVTSGDVLFALETEKPISVCRFNGYQTEDPRLVIVPKTGNEYWFNKKTIDVRNLDLFTYINSKFIYSERHVKTQVEKLYSNLIMKKCELERETLRTQLSVAVHHPEEFALIQTKQPGHIAVPRGELIYLIKCQPVEVKIRKTNRCYIELPVNYSNQNYFMAPITHLLLQHGTEISCSELLSPGYHVNGDWYGFNPILHRLKTPAELQPSIKPDWIYEDPGKLINSGLYSHDSISQLRHQIMYPSERRAISNIVVRNILGHEVDQQNVDTGNLFPSSTWNSIEQTLKSKVWGIFDDFGHICASLLALYFIIKVIKYIIDVLVNARSLKSLYGWSWKLAASIWNSATQHILHNHHQQENETLQEVVTIKTLLEDDKRTHSCENSKTEDFQARQERVSSLYPSLT